MSSSHVRLNLSSLTKLTRCRVGKDTDRSMSINVNQHELPNLITMIRNIFEPLLECKSMTLKTFLLFHLRSSEIRRRVSLKNQKKTKHWGRVQTHILGTLTSRKPRCARCCWPFTTLKTRPQTGDTPNHSTLAMVFTNQALKTTLWRNAYLHRKSSWHLSWMPRRE